MTTQPPPVAPGTVQVWSDLLCPFAHLAPHRLRQARERLGVPVAVEHRTFAPTLRLADGTAFSNPGTTVEWAGPWAAGYPVITSHDPEALADIVRAAAPVAAGT